MPPRRPPERVGEQMLPFDEPPEQRAVGVSQFLARLNTTLRNVPDTWVRGEIGEFRTWRSGHAYFTLKDPFAMLNAMMWSEDVARLPFKVEPGAEFLARGRVSVYAPNGRLTFQVVELQPYGKGALQLALEQLKRRLAAEGLFDASRKRPLPRLPRCIGVVTSRHGAAIRDILKVLSARFPNAHVTLYPVTVQGNVAAGELVRALNAFSRLAAADVVIVARGGGSKEDLAAFNDERVVRAVAACRIPTIAAVGHEIDVTLTDLAADVRAATPSQAAELVVERRQELERALEAREKELSQALRSRLKDARSDLAHPAEVLRRFQERAGRAVLASQTAGRALIAAVRDLPSRYRARLTSAEGRLESWPARVSLPFLSVRIVQEQRALSDRLRRRLGRAEGRLAELAGQLSSLDPLRVLARGYAVVYNEGRPAPLTDAADVSPGDALRVVLGRGELDARVTRVVPRQEEGLRRER